MSNPSVDRGFVDDPHWKPLRLFNFYRLVISSLLVAIILSGGPELLGKHDPQLFVASNAFYLFLSLALGVFSYYRWPDFELQVYAQALLDIGAITVLVYASGGVGSGLGMLMIAAVAGASFLTHGRSALGIAAMGALALLTGEVYADLRGGLATTSYTQTGLLSGSLFLTAWLANTLAQRAMQSEALAMRRGIDLANMAELNGLIVNRMQCGIMVVDDEAKVHLINQAARSLLGYTAADKPPSLKEISFPAYRLFLKWLPSQEEGTPPQMLNHDRDTILQTRFMRAGARREDRGTVIYVEDTAEINRQIQESKLASLSRLTASIAHEIRNPLGAISHAAQLLGESPKLDQADQRMVDMIQEQSRRMNAIIRDVLRLYRREQPNPEQILLKAWIVRFNDQFGRDNGITSEWATINVEPENVEIHMDPNHLHQVLWNLYFNALKYGRDASGVPAVTLTGGQPQDGSAAYLDVIDRGLGIAPETRAQLFEPFFTTSSQGTGLGLFIARELCQANGGDLSFTPNPDGGCCFRMRFSAGNRQFTFQNSEEYPVANGAHR